MLKVVEFQFGKRRSELRGKPDVEFSGLETVSLDAGVALPFLDFAKSISVGRAYRGSGAAIVARGIGP